MADGDFEKDVLPILNEHCIGCHGPDVQESKLRLDTMLFAMRGGSSGEPIVVPGESGRSHLIERLTSRDPKMKMPPEGEPLADSAVNQLRAWIDNESLWKEAKDQLETKTLFDCVKLNAKDSRLTINFVGDNYARDGRPILLQLRIPL